MKQRLIRMSPHRLGLVVAALAVLAACASPPPAHEALEEARSRLSDAQRQPQVAALAPSELARASEAVQQATQAQASGEGAARVSHLAYLGLQQVVIAEETASSRAAEAVVAGASAERDRLRLATRTRETELARARQSTAEADSAAKTEALSRAEAATRNERELASRRERQVMDLETQLRDLDARFTDRGAIVTLGDLLFDTGEARLRPEGTRHLDRLATFLRRTPAGRAAIEGYTDNVGSALANQVLSTRRADAVMRALIELGVPADQLSTQGFGEENPVATNGTASGRQMNRRVEVVFARAAH